MFYPEYVDMEMEYLGEIMELEMNKFLHEELPFHMSSAFSSMCKKFSSWCTFLERQTVAAAVNHHYLVSKCTAQQKDE